MQIPRELEQIDPNEITAENALSLFYKSHDAHLKLCDVLEGIADSLPDEIRPDECAYVVRVLEPAVPLHHSLEETVFFPCLLERSHHDPALVEIVERLSGEHRTDEGYIAEAIELLRPLAGGNMSVNAEAAGYLLRGLFESWRRHITFETELILPRAAQVFTAADRDNLATGLYAFLTRLRPSPVPAGQLN